jgi:hypothetical protein
LDIGHWYDNIQYPIPNSFTSPLIARIYFAG